MLAGFNGGPADRNGIWHLTCRRNPVSGYLQALYKLEVKPSAHAEAEDIIIGMFGSEGEQWEDRPPDEP